MSLLWARLDADYPDKPGVLRGAELRIAPGEIVGVIGPSGSGKSTIALALLRLLEFRGGRVRGRLFFEGRDLMRCAEPELRRVRGREIALVTQSPIAALNPALRLETHLREVWRAHRPEPWSQGRGEACDLLARLDLPAGAAFLRKFPRQLSVGQAQRVAVAMAVLHRPKLLIADEPTSALDPRCRAELLDLLANLNGEMGMAILYISHDLESVRAFCHRAVLVRDGTVQPAEAISPLPTDPIAA